MFEFRPSRLTTAGIYNRVLLDRHNFWLNAIIKGKITCLTGVMSGLILLRYLENHNESIAL